VLKISYDGLDEQEKCIFLDIACFFVQMGTKRDDVIDILRGCGFSGEIAMTNLVEKCLIKIRQHDNTLWMHDQIRDMGRQIVLNENHVDPGMRSRLWDRAEIMSVLKSKKVKIQKHCKIHAWIKNTEIVSKIILLIFYSKRVFHFCCSCAANSR
jgi:hypothetical protein